MLILKECRQRQTFTSIAARYRVSVPTVIRYFDRIQYAKPTRLPWLLALDEFKGNAQGQKYQTSITNPFTHKILDILPNQNTQDIIKYFRSFPKKQRNRVRWVIMDISNLFRKVVQEVFPNAFARTYQSGRSGCASGQKDQCRYLAERIQFPWSRIWQLALPKRPAGFHGLLL